MEKLEELLKEDFEEIELEYREDFGRPVKRFIFDGRLLSYHLTEYSGGTEGVYLTPKGQFLHYQIDDYHDIGFHTIYPDFKAFQDDSNIEEELYYEVVYEIGYEIEIETIVLDI